MSYESSLDIQLASIDNAQTDPWLRDTLTEMQSYNELFAAAPTSRDEAVEVAESLNADLAPLIGSDAVVSGYLMFQDEWSESDQPVRSYYDDEQITLGGVLIEPLAGHNDDAENYFRLKIGMTREAIDRDGDHVLLLGTANPEDIVKIDIPGMMSSARARAVLESYFPETVEDIDQALLNSDGDECMLVRQLDDIYCDISRSAGRQLDDEMMRRGCQALEVYISHLFGFDKQAPYMLAADGDIWMVDDETGDLNIAEYDGSALAHIIDVGWYARPGGEIDTVVSPHLDVFLIPADPEIAPYHVLVPTDVITEFESVRRNFYRDETSDTPDETDSIED